jgi:argininosuccinate synthase
MITPVEQVKAKEEIISFEVEKGVPVGLNSGRKSPLVLLQELSELEENMALEFAISLKVV